MMQDISFMLEYDLTSYLGFHTVLNVIFNLFRFVQRFFRKDDLEKELSVCQILR